MTETRRTVQLRRPHVFDALDFAYPAPAEPAITREDFGQGFAVLAAAQPARPMPPATAELYYRALASYAPADFVAGVRAAIDTCEQWPSIPMLRRLCDEARQTRREREGRLNMPGQAPTPERAALVAELHAASEHLEATMAGAASHPQAWHDALERHARAVRALSQK